MKNVIAFLMASSLAGCCSPGPDCPTEPDPAGNLRASRVYDYHAKLTGPDYGCCITIDLLHPPFPPGQAMKEGQGNVGETPSWTTAPDGALLMTLTAPSMLQTFADGVTLKTPSMGIFYDDLAYDKDSVFSVAAAFRRPTRRTSDDSWSVAVVARTGGAHDDPNLARLQLSLRRKGDIALLRVQEGLSDPATQKVDGTLNIDISDPKWGRAFQEIYEDGETFTLKLIVNRKMGYGSAQLVTKTQNIPIGFRMAVFTPANVDRVTTVGATLANTGPGPDLTASVEVADFWIDDN